MASYDTNGDGWSDTFSSNVDGDGIIDVTKYDLIGDGRIDLVIRFRKCSKGNSLWSLRPNRLAVLCVPCYRKSF